MGTTNDDEFSDEFIRRVINESLVPIKSDNMFSSDKDCYYC